MEDLFSAVIPFIKEAHELVAVQEHQILPQGHQNPPLEVVEGPSTLQLKDLLRLEVDNRVVVPAKTHLRNIVTSADVLHSWAVPSEEGVPVLPQTGVGQSEAAETASTGQNRAVEQAGPSSRQWETKSPSNLNSSDWRSLARCFESLPEPGEEVSSFPTAHAALAQAPAPAPNPPVIPQFIPLISDEQRLVELWNTLHLSFSILSRNGNEIPDLLSFDRRLDIAVPIERNVETALLEDGFSGERIRGSGRINEIRRVLFRHPKTDMLLSEKTLNRYFAEIQTNGTRNSTPYRNVIKAIKNLNIVL